MRRSSWRTAARYSSSFSRSGAAEAPSGAAARPRARGRGCCGARRADAARRSRRVAAEGEQPLEGQARVDLLAHGRARRAPRDRGGVGAAVAGVAGARLSGRLAAELQRRQARLVAEAGGRHLVDGDARVDVRAGRLAGLAARQEGGGGAGVVARSVAVRPRLVQREAGQHEQLGPARARAARGWGRARSPCPRPRGSSSSSRRRWARTGTPAGAAAMPAPRPRAPRGARMSSSGSGEGGAESAQHGASGRALHSLLSSGTGGFSAGRRGARAEAERVEAHDLADEAGERRLLGERGREPGPRLRSSASSTPRPSA